MKTLVLSGSLVKLLNKVSNAGYPFYQPVEQILESCNDLLEDEQFEASVSRDDFKDVIDMVGKYLKDDTLSESDFPSEIERFMLNDFLKQLKESRVLAK